MITFKRIFSHGKSCYKQSEKINDKLGIIFVTMSQTKFIYLIYIKELLKLEKEKTNKPIEK